MTNTHLALIVAAGGDSRTTRDTRQPAMSAMYQGVGGWPALIVQNHALQAGIDNQVNRAVLNLKQCAAWPWLSYGPPWAIQRMCHI